MGILIENLKNKVSKRSFLFFIAFFIFNFAFIFADSTEKKLLENNIPVYIKKIDNSRVCAVSIVVSGGILHFSPEYSGIENAVFNMMTSGSTNYSKQQLQAFSYYTQGGISSSSNRYGSVLSMNCIDSYFDSTLDILIDGFTNPLFDEKEYSLMIQSFNQNVQYILNEPRSMLFYYADKILYDGTPYATETNVTPESIKNITVENMKNFHSDLLDSRRISVVAVGNFDENALLLKLNEKIGKISAKKNVLPKFKEQNLKVSGEPVVLFSKDAKNSGFIIRTFASPSVRSGDYAVSRLVELVYSDILYNVVRERDGICYTPSSFVFSSDCAFGVEELYRVSNLSDFKSSLDDARKIMMEGKVISGRDSSGNFIFNKLEEKLEGYKNKYVNMKYSSQDTVFGIASRMCAGILQFNDISASENLTQKVKDVTTSDILRVFNKYWQSDNFRWFAVVAPEEENKLPQM